MRWLLLALLAGPARAEDPAPDPAVYTCHVFVTGSDGRNRTAAMRQCVQDVLVKLSGDPALADAPVPGVSEMIEDFAYLDMMSGMPLHDEQGTRDRPFDFIAHVDPFLAAQAVRRLGRTPWLEPRPAIWARIRLRRGGVDSRLTADGAAVERQRQSLLAAADRFGLRVRLPAEAMPKDEAGFVLFPQDGHVPIDARTRRLDGVLAWNDAAFAWDATWTLSDEAMEPTASWTAESDSFDAAFRSGIGGAATRLAH